MSLVPVEDDSQRVADALLTVAAGQLQLIRDHLDVLLPELQAVVRASGWTVRGIECSAADPGAAAKVQAPPKRREVVDAIASAVAQLKSYEVAAFCDRLELAPHPDPAADPFNSKAVYVRSRLGDLDLHTLVKVGARVLDELDAPALEEVLDRCAANGVDGSVKNLVFASTRKPDLVLTDALRNDAALVNTDEALIYDGGIPEEGLTFRALVHWFLPAEAAADEHEAARTLFRRLQASVGSDPERCFYSTYAVRYRRYGLDQPALLPQVWLHYDPRSARERGDRSVLGRQRMDFLLLLSGRQRIVLEVDGSQHYSDGGRPSPTRYADMVRQDRDLRLAGYEVYRFGAAELPDQRSAEELLGPFFDKLLGT